jgi:ankyrin repeat protein
MSRACSGNCPYTLRLAANELYVIVLVDLGAGAATANNDGGAALHFAAANGHEAVVQLLVGLGAIVNGKRMIINQQHFT